MTDKKFKFRGCCTRLECDKFRIQVTTEQVVAYDVDKSRPGIDSLIYTNKCVSCKNAIKLFYNF